MNYVTRIVLEMAFIGVTLALFGIFISYMTNLVRGEPIKWWPNHFKDMIVGTFITGSLYHLLFEMVGLNKLYCSNMMK